MLSLQHRWIPLCAENFDLSFSIAIAPIKLVPAFKHRYDLSKIEESKSTPSHLCIQEGKV